MPRPRKYICDPRTRRQVDGLSLHRASGVVYSILPDGQRKYWGRAVCAAIDAYHAAQSRSEHCCSDGAASFSDPIPQALSSIEEAGKAWEADKKGVLKSASISNPLIFWRQFVG